MSLEAVAESQDSQAVFDAHQALFGVASVRTAGGVLQRRRHADCGQISSLIDAGGEEREAADANPARPAGRRLASEAGQGAGEAAACMREGKEARPESDADAGPTTAAVPEFQPPEAGHAISPAPNETRAVKAPLDAAARLQPTTTAARMDTSQQTPTQVNEDRDYHIFYAALPSSPGHKSTQHNTDDEPRTLKEGDTGAVDFGNLSDLVRPSSQVSEDGGFDTTRGGWRAQRTSQLQQSNPAQTPYRPHAVAPVTPALPGNPFAARPGVEAPLAGSQLFGQTQQASSAVKISPTSSRPSPNLLPNSVLPDLLETSPLKNRTNVSSPTDVRTSSPQRPEPDQVPRTVLKDKTGHVARRDSPEDDTPNRDERIPESPTDQTPRPFVGRQPLAQYEPMKESQQRKSSDDAQPDLLSDNEHDEAFQKAERRKRAERKRAQAAEEMEKVSFARGSRRDSGEQPSKKRRRTNKAHDDTTDSGAVGSRARGKGGVGGSSDKPSALTPGTPAADSIKATPVQSGALPEAEPDEAIAFQTRVDADEEMIPATSPVLSTKGSQNGASCASEPELPAVVDGGPGKGEDEETTQTSSFPPTRRRVQRRYGARKRQVRRNPLPSSSTSDPVEPSGKAKRRVSTLDSPASTASTAQPRVASDADRRDEVDVETGKPQQELRKTASSSSKEVGSAHTMTRSHGQDPTTPMQKRASTAPMAPPSSSLTTLSATPASLVNETPCGRESATLERPSSLNMSPSTSSRCLGRRTTRTTCNSESPQPLARTRLARRGMKPDPDSADELHESPTPSAMEKSAAYIKSGRSFRQSIGSSHRGRRLFENMAFALSSQSDKAEQQRSKLESQIVQAGGLILKDGFQELFEVSKVLTWTGTVHDEGDGLRLPRASSGCGFTSLIADGHSRKPKYMQALALGLPCLSQQWITASLGKGELVDWEPYLLCAGSSAVLGNAIRSRTLVPYAAAEARLAEVVERRRKLLEGQSILMLLDGKKGRKETKQQYMFLVQGLGPRAICRTSTARQAREAYREREQAGVPFDWLYMDKWSGSVEAVVSGPGPGPGPGTGTGRGAGPKKRRPTGEPRVLTDELLIQSLILGRMVEAGEIEP